MNAVTIEFWTAVKAGAGFALGWTMMAVGVDLLKQLWKVITT